MFSGNFLPGPKPCASRPKSVSVQRPPVAASFQTIRALRDFDGADGELEAGRPPPACPAGAAASPPPPKSCQLLRPRASRARLSSRSLSRASLISMRRDSSGNSPSLSSALPIFAIGSLPNPGALLSVAPPTRDADRREHRKLKLAVERQLPAGRPLHGGRDVVLVVVRVEQHRDRDEQRGKEQITTPTTMPRIFSVRFMGSALRWSPARERGPHPNKRTDGR